MKGWCLSIWPSGLVALGRAFAVSTALFAPIGLPASVFGQLFPDSSESGVSAEAVEVQRALILLERLHEDQTGLRQAIARLEATQVASVERQAQAIRHHQIALAKRLASERTQQEQSLEAMAQMILTILFCVAGVILFAMGAIAWSLLRALQRLPLRPPLAHLPLPQLMAGQDETGLPIFQDAQLLSAIAELEKRLLRLGEGVSRKNPPATPDAGKASAPFPGDFL